MNATPLKIVKNVGVCAMAMLLALASSAAPQSKKKITVPAEREFWSA